jgi:hypothetical protein
VTLARAILVSETLENSACGNGEVLNVCGSAGTSEGAAAPVLGAIALDFGMAWAAKGVATPAKIDSVSAVLNRVIE